MARASSDVNPGLRAERRLEVHHHEASEVHHHEASAQDGQAGRGTTLCNMGHARLGMLVHVWDTGVD